MSYLIKTVVAILVMVSATELSKRSNALAAIILLGLAPLGRLPVAPIPYLRPPLRGPPASI